MRELVLERIMEMLNRPCGGLHTVIYNKDDAHKYKKLAFEQLIEDGKYPFQDQKFDDWLNSLTDAQLLIHFERILRLNYKYFG